MSEAKLSSKGQITIPKEIRTKLHLDTGDIIQFIPQKNGFAIQVKRLTPECLKGIIQKPTQTISIAQMNRDIKKRRQL